MRCLAINAILETHKSIRTNAIADLQRCRQFAHLKGNHSLVFNGVFRQQPPDAERMSLTDTVSAVLRLRSKSAPASLSAGGCRSR